MQRILRTKDFQIFEITSSSYRSCQDLTVTGIEVFKSAGTLVIEVQAPSQQPGRSKPWVPISRGIEHCLVKIKTERIFIFVPYKDTVMGRNQSNPVTRAALQSVNKSYGQEH